MRRLASFQAAIARTKQQAAEQRAEIDDWEQAQVSQFDRQVAALQMELRACAVQLVAQDPLHRKSVALPSGTLGFREPSMATEKTDPEATCEWLQQHGYSDLVRIKREPKLDQIKKRFSVRGTHYVVPDGDIAGEIVPGLEVRTAEEQTFFATPNAGTVLASDAVESTPDDRLF
jgi:phage host-nuclease inhibitor protein Gam